MQYSRRSGWLWLGLVVGPSLLVGCAEGPFGGALASWSPWVREKWAADEKFGPTYHRRVAELRELREGVAALEPARRERLAVEMADLVRSDPNPVLRSEALGVLGELGGGTASAALAAAVSDGDKDVRIAACRAWGRVHTVDALTALGRVVEHDADVDVRLSALDALATFNDTTAVQSLGKALDDSDPAVQFRAVQSLKIATGRDLGDSIPAWRDFVQGREPTAPAQASLMQRVYELF